MRPALFILPLLIAAPSVAQAPAAVPGAADPSRVTAGTYATDPAHTQVQWAVSHFGFNDYFGLFGDVTGSLVIDPARLSDAKVDLTIPVASVATSSKGLTEHLLRAGKDGGKPDFFGANSAPARFVSTSVAVTGTTAKITGNLTLNGVTRPVVLDTRFVGAGANPFNKKATVGFHATTSIKRSEFGIGFGVPMIEDDVDLTISVAFEKSA